MTNPEVEAYRNILLTLGRRIDGDAALIGNDALRQTGGEPSGNLSNAPTHPADLATDTFDQEVSLGLLENEGQLLEQINAALKRIDRGDFGRCEECGCAIPEERLEAVPYAEHCVSCARQVEEEAEG